MRLHDFQDGDLCQGASVTWLVAVNTVLALYDAACDDDKGKGRARLSGGYRGGLEAHVPREGRG